MTVYPCLIVGTDGSVTADRAVCRAAVLAEALSAPLVVAAAFQPTRPEDLGPPSVRAQMPDEGWMSTNYHAAADTARDGAALATRTADVAVETATPEGEPATALLQLAEAHPGSLLAVGSQGMSASTRFLLGSVANKVSHHAVGDVLVIRTVVDRDPVPPRRLLIATDGSKTARKAVERGVELAAALAAEATILCAHDDAAQGREVVEAAGQQAVAAGAVWHPDVRPGPAAEAILDAAEGHDLVVLGNRGMTGAARFLLGSVPNKVSHHITTDLLIVRTAS